MKNYKFKDNEVIHCETEEQAIAVLKMAHEQGFIKLIADIDWFCYKKDTCYNVITGIIGEVEFYRLRNFKIIKAKYILMESNKDKAERLRAELQEVEEAIKKENEFKVGDVIVKDWKCGGSKDMFLLQRIEGNDFYGDPYLIDNDIISSEIGKRSGYLNHKSFTLRNSTKEETEQFRARVKELSKPKLPVLNGCDGKDILGHIKYGNKTFLKYDIRAMIAMGVTSFNLMIDNKKVKVSKSQVKALKEYLK